MKSVNLQKALGLQTCEKSADVFSPHYQFTHPDQFGMYVDYYLKTRWDAENHPEHYLMELRHAVKFANKSILLNNIGLGYDEDLETLSPEAFKSMFAKLASEDPNLLVKGENVFYTPDLVKSFAQGDGVNQYYENLWKNTFHTLKGESRSEAE